MRDDPRMNLNRLQQLLLEEEMPELYLSEDEMLMQRVDDLIADLALEEEYVGKYTRKSQGVRAEQTQSRPRLDESAAVLTKTKKQLRREAKQRKKAEKKASVNRSIKGLVVLAILEVLGILAILGWWLQ